MSRRGRPKERNATVSKAKNARPRDAESQKERGVALRAGFYIFGTHLFAGFVWLLFYLGEHANK